MVLSSLVLMNVLGSLILNDSQQNTPHVKRPNIVFIVADDVGWNDVGWVNPAIKTPHLDLLARDGVILNSSYTHPVCSPSRAAMLTGLYSHKLGMQHGSLQASRPHGLPLNTVLLPQRLKQLGYATHLIGKWHLGFCKWAYTPTYRGFDTFYGFYSGAADHYRHRSNKEKGYDFRENKKVLPADKTKGKYSTHLFASRAVNIIANHRSTSPLFLMLAFQAAHIPLQILALRLSKLYDVAKVPMKYERIYNTTRNRRRRLFSGMVTAMDEAVGRVVSTLIQHDKLNDTIIVFTSDNGASARNGGSNWPLRGRKSTLWEGGTRVPTFIWSSLLAKKGYTHAGLFHATDWYATLLAAAGVPAVEFNGRQKLNGLDQWSMLHSGHVSKRKEFVYAIDETTNMAAFRMGKYKLIDGNPGNNRDWFPPYLPEKYEDMQNPKVDRNVTLLFDLDSDPYEMIDVSQFHPEIVNKMRSRLSDHKSKLMPANYPRKVWQSHPKFWDGVWSPGWC